MNKDRLRVIESDLVEGLKKGQSDSLKTIYNSYYPVIKSLVQRNNGSEHEAKDIFQESLILLFEKLQQPGFRLTCSIKTFIYAVSKRLWLKKWNEQKVKVYDTQFESEPSDMENLMHYYDDQEKLIQRMLRVIEELGEPCATVLKDFYIEDKSMNEIAVKFGYTNWELKNQKYKCLQRLKKLFFDGVQDNNSEQ